ncbi:hypothetical protein [Falsibacillus pallidus]|uniref:hypothetical protein n=1 Tax=Falsibacillus pallidus TaxID=493781 RepID=UPI000E0A8B1C|nr:hypothetical protein [Falsibacillus pallidus]
MEKKTKKKKREKEIWKIWDGIFTSGLFSFMNDAEEARHDDKKFRDMLWSLLFGVAFTVVLFFCIFRFLI